MCCLSFPTLTLLCQRHSICSSRSVKGRQMSTTPVRSITMISEYKGLSLPTTKRAAPTHRRAAPFPILPRVTTKRTAHSISIGVGRVCTNAPESLTHRSSLFELRTLNGPAVVFNPLFTLVEATAPGRGGGELRVGIGVGRYVWERCRPALNIHPTGSV